MTAGQGVMSSRGKGLGGEGEGRRIGLRSRINLKIGTKNGLRWRAGFGLMEAR